MKSNTQSVLRQETILRSNTQSVHRQDLQLGKIHNQYSDRTFGEVKYTISTEIGPSVRSNTQSVQRQETLVKSTIISTQAISGLTCNINTKIMHNFLNEYKTI